MQIIANHCVFDNNFFTICKCIYLLKVRYVNMFCDGVLNLFQTIVLLKLVVRTRKTGREMPTGCWLRTLYDMPISCDLVTYKYSLL